jgi:hypothetical protein
VVEAELNPPAEHLFLEPVQHCKAVPPEMRAIPEVPVAVVVDIGVVVLDQTQILVQLVVVDRVTSTQLL